MPAEPEEDDAEFLLECVDEEADVDEDLYPGGFVPSELAEQKRLDVGTKSVRDVKAESVRKVIRRVMPRIQGYRLGQYYSIRSLPPAEAFRHILQKPAVDRETDDLAELVVLSTSRTGGAGV